ncbi:hypothetical protein [Solirubrobacter soli]|uniref:hypothetical protein n=1 Tax=Solirubrobacter soli TaxID=363832 RepID=UPI00040399D0|nr:hypothetical protein [Solirubrobacter soli]
MLSLLPGLRDLRVPVAAGYIWLVASWVALEPVVPDRDAASGVLASIYHLTDALSLIGLGVFISFVAYVVGALSTSLFGSLATGLHARRRIRRLDPISVHGRRALDELARLNRTELQRTLSMSGIDVPKFLNQSGVPQGPSHPPRENVGGPGTAQPLEYDWALERRIAAAVQRELDTIASTRLLGRDDAFFSLIDRLQSEAEFRRGIVPPILFAGAVLAVRIGPPWWPLVVLVTLALGYGLVLDSVKLERRATERLLDAMTDNRLNSPFLERLQARATKIAGSTPADDADEAANQVAAAIGRAIGRLEHVDEPEPALADKAQRDTAEARTTLDELRPRLPPEAAARAHEAMTELVSASDAWAAMMRGDGSGTDGRAALDRGKVRYRAFLSEAKDAIARMREPAQAGERPARLPAPASVAVVGVQERGVGDREHARDDEGEQQRDADPGQLEADHQHDAEHEAAEREGDEAAHVWKR